MFETTVIAPSLLPSVMNDKLDGVQSSNTINICEANYHVTGNATTELNIFS